MEIKQAFRFCLRPTKRQESLMRQFAGHCRYVYNEALKLQVLRHESEEAKLGYAELCKILTEWRNNEDTIWLRDAPVHALQQKLKDLEKAYANFFQKRARFPQKKRKGRHDTFRYPDPKQIKLDEQGNRIFLPKLGWVKYRNSRNTMGAIKNATISLSADKWFVSIQTEREVPSPIPKATAAVGIDMGIANFATMSDGTHLEPLNSFKRHEKRLARYQKAMSRKQRFSSNWKKAKSKVSKLHVRIANIRRDYLHKASTAISKNHAMVCMEDLRVRNMSKSASGTRERCGKNVKAKSGLNKAILDQGWYEFRRQIEYKLLWNGGLFKSVPPKDTSLMCHKCEHVQKENRKNQAQFHCVNCGHEQNADHNAALNILAAGTAALACGDHVRPNSIRSKARLMKQESPPFKEERFKLDELSGAIVLVLKEDRSLSVLKDKEYTRFEDIKHTRADGSTYWLARELAPVLEYTKWENFTKVIGRAKIACNNSGHEVTHHFPDVRKMVAAGVSTKPLVDYELSRYACYLIVQNGGPRKEIIALGQTYFALQTYRQEIADKFNQLDEDSRRLVVRGEVKQWNQLLAGAAREAGVIDDKEFAEFQNAGYMGLYGGMTVEDIHENKGLTVRDKILDFMGSTELIANLFRISQTEEKLNQECQLTMSKTGTQEIQVIVR